MFEAQRILNFHFCQTSSTHFNFQTHGRGNKVLMQNPKLRLNGINADLVFRWKLCEWKFQYIIRNPKWCLKWYQNSLVHKLFNDNLVNNVTPFSNARVTDVFTYSGLTRKLFVISAVPRKRNTEQLSRSNRFKHWQNMIKQGNK